MGRSSVTWNLRCYADVMQQNLSLAAFESGYPTFYLCALGTQLLNLSELRFLIYKMDYE